MNWPNVNALSRTQYVAACYERQITLAKNRLSFNIFFSILQNFVSFVKLGLLENLFTTTFRGPFIKWTCTDIWNSFVFYGLPGGFVPMQYHVYIGVKSLNLTKVDTNSWVRPRVLILSKAFIGLRMKRMNNSHYSNVPQYWTQE